MGFQQDGSKKSYAELKSQIDSRINSRFSVKQLTPKQERTDLASALLDFATIQNRLFMHLAHDKQQLLPRFVTPKMPSLHKEIYSYTKELVERIETITRTVPRGRSNDDYFDGSHIYRYYDSLAKQALKKANADPQINLKAADYFSKDTRNEIKQTLLKVEHILYRASLLEQAVSRLSRPVQSVQITYIEGTLEMNRRMHNAD